MSNNGYRGKARPADCQCESNYTCRHCLQNAPAYFYTPLTNAESMYLQINQLANLYDTSKKR